MLPIRILLLLRLPLEFFGFFAVTALALLSGGAAAAAALVVATAWSDAASEVGGADAASIAVHGVCATT